MLLHQDGSRHEWVEDQRWDLIVTMDDATNEHYAMQFVEEEGTRSSLQGVATVIREHALFSAFYCDRGSHYWLTPETGAGLPSKMLFATAKLPMIFVRSRLRRPCLQPGECHFAHGLASSRCESMTCSSCASPVRSE
jgi:hypothetical protein